MQKRQWAIGVLGAIAVLVIIFFAASYAVLGTSVYNESDYSSITAKNSAGGSVSLVNVYKKTGYLYFTPSAVASEIVIQYSFAYQDFKDSGIRQITVDTAKLGLTSFNKIKFYLTDGTNNLYLGSQAEVGAISFQVTYDDVKEALNTASKTTLRIVCVDVNGTAVDAVKAEEQAVSTEFTMGGGYQSVTGLVAAGLIGFVVALKRAIAGVTSALGAAVAAITTSEVILTIIVAVAILIVFAYFVPKRRR